MQPPSSEPRSRVWLVEDSPLEAEMARRPLADAYDIEVFADGASMIERLADGAPDLLLLDWRLPNISGLEVCRFVRSKWNQNALPIVMLTAVADRADTVEAISAGANDYLTKPYDTSELLARVAAVARTRNLHKRLEYAEDREREARREAQAANVAKNEFLAVTSHELRTPLNVILGWVTLMRDGQLDDARMLRGMETIERNARIQEKLIEDILDFSRIISGRLRLEEKPISFAAVVRTAIDAVALPAQTKKVDVRVDLGDGPSRVCVDAERILQVVSNLLSNAVKFTPEGGHIDVRLRPKGAMSELVVQDSGEGIDAEFLPWVFERFRQAEGSSTRRHGGLGLGLAVVRSLVEAHDGTVKAESEGHGKGARFTVALPLSEQEPVDRTRETPQKQAPRERGHRLDGIRALVVDDDVDGRELVATALRLRGATATACESAEAALAALEAQRFDVLVSDIGMPQIDGLELVRRVRARAPEDGGTMPALAASAYARDIDKHHALEAGFDAYLAKPLTPTALVAAVVDLLAAKKGT